MSRGGNQAKLSKVKRCYRHRVVGDSGLKVPPLRSYRPTFTSCSPLICARLFACPRRGLNGPLSSRPCAPPYTSPGFALAVALGAQSPQCPAVFAGGGTGPRGLPDDGVTETSAAEVQMGSLGVAGVAALDGVSRIDKDATPSAVPRSGGGGHEWVAD